MERKLLRSVLYVAAAIAALAFVGPFFDRGTPAYANSRATAASAVVPFLLAIAGLACSCSHVGIKLGLGMAAGSRGNDDGRVGGEGERPGDNRRNLSTVTRPRRREDPIG